MKALPPLEPFGHHPSIRERTPAPGPLTPRIEAFLDAGSRLFKPDDPLPDNWKEMVTMERDKPGSVMADPKLAKVIENIRLSRVHVVEARTLPFRKVPFEIWAEWDWRQWVIGLYRQRGHVTVFHPLPCLSIHVQWPYTKPLVKDHECN